MNFFTFTKLGRTLLLAGVVAVSVVCWVGCGGGDEGNDNPANNNGNNNNGNNNNGGGSVPIEKWMKTNLNVETADSWCYDNDPINCDKYGRLYTWEAAKRACQLDGKRLPTRAEWEALVKAAGGADIAGKKLKARSGWYNNGNGTDDYGFSALPGGHRNSNGYFSGAGFEGFWWTATEGGSDDAYYRLMSGSGDGVYESSNEDDGYSVRCVQD